MIIYLRGEVGWIKVQEYNMKQLLSIWTKQKHPPRVINRKHCIRSNTYGAGVAPSSTYALPQGISLLGFLTRRPKTILGWDKSGIRRCSGRGREKISGGRGGWGGWINILGVISSKYGIYSGWWGNLRWDLWGA